jgi:hypothetical protein
MATGDFPDFDGVRLPIELPNANGRAAATASRPVALSNEDKAVLDALVAAITTLLAQTDTLETLSGTGNTSLASILATLTTIDGRVDGLEALIASTNTKLDTSITALQLIDNLAAALNAQNALRVQLEKANGDDVDPTPSLNDGDTDSGGSFLSGWKASPLSALTVLTAGQRASAAADLDRALMTRPYSIKDVVRGRVVITSTTATAVIASPGAGLRLVITAIHISNSSATPVECDILDGTAGAAIDTISAPPGKSGAFINLSTPLLFSADTAAAIQSDTAVTSLKVTFIGFKTKVV